MAQAQAEAQSKSIRVLNTYTTKGRNYGAAVLGDDGLIWNATITSVLRRFHPKTPGKIVSEQKLNGGVYRAATKFQLSGKENVMVFGTGTGVECFDTSGKNIFSYGNCNTCLAEQPVEFESKLIFVGNDGSLFSLTVNPFKFAKITKTTCGALTSPAGIFKLGSHPNITYAVESMPDVISGELQQNICVSDLAGGATSQKVAQRKEGSLVPVISIGPTIIPIPGSEEVAFWTTNRGHVLKSSGSTAEVTPSVRTDLEVCAPVVVASQDRLIVIGTSNSLKTFDAITFTTSGKILFRKSIVDSDGSAISAKASGIPAVFKGTEGRSLAFIGFTDHYVRLIDLNSATVLASLKLPVTEQIENICRLDENRFWVSEESGGEPDEITKHYLIRIE